MMKSALKKHEIDSMKPLDEATELQILNTLIKQRRESIEMFRKGGREDLAAKEEAELKMIEGYMPAMASDDEHSQRCGSSDRRGRCGRSQSDGCGHEGRAVASCGQAGG